jgi:hypothetical protein
MAVAAPTWENKKKKEVKKKKTNGKKPRRVRTRFGSVEEIL